MREIPYFINQSLAMNNRVLQFVMDVTSLSRNTRMSSIVHFVEILFARTA
jgi:hypothetical protein